MLWNIEEHYLRPGVRMYNNLKTLFYNGEKLWEGDDEYFGLLEFAEEPAHPLIYNREERNSWQQIMVLPGVEEILTCTFQGCINVEKVVMYDVRWIRSKAYMYCDSLRRIVFSRNLELIESNGISDCKSLPSIFLPESCREIRDFAFIRCPRLMIVTVPHHTEIDGDAFEDTALDAHYCMRLSLFERFRFRLNDWIKNINVEEEYSLHRACSSSTPSEEIIYQIMKEQGGPKAFTEPNTIEITPSQYLSENPFAEHIKEKSLIQRYILEMMGETV
ncbi:hypothetical protein CTEN210_03716 [Chaetoceros tenuissimus]|uniref:Leucine-rich repeat domain-containing protein n=1 Tax=Chaetoceros tenuissimus TaxID=426638 RepID=A0AAD3CLU3_9STRA|nr:hypothetical protein CTEN210_03716 [Chaetoceros tenuissimus]